MTHDEQNNSSDTGSKVPSYKCAFCQGKIVSCNCEKGFKNAIETSLREEIAFNLRRHYYRAAKYEHFDESAAWDHAISIAQGLCDPDACYFTVPLDKKPFMTKDELVQSHPEFKELI